MKGPAVAGVTVPQVVRALGVPDAKGVAWAVGRVAAELWRERSGGKGPPVRLVPKNYGEGSHHMAVYPREFRRTLVRLVKLAALGRATLPPARKPRGAQRELFGGGR